MFSLSENNVILLMNSPVDMRIGLNGMCGQVRANALNPTSGYVYAFIGRSRKVMKLLHWERGGYTLYYKRLEEGRFHPKVFSSEEGFRRIRWDELFLLVEGISPKVARRKRFQVAEK